MFNKRILAVVLAASFMIPMLQTPVSYAGSCIIAGLESTLSSEQNQDNSDETLSSEETGDGDQVATAQEANQGSNQGTTEFTANEVQHTTTPSKTGSVEVELDFILPVENLSATNLQGTLKNSDGLSYSLAFDYHNNSQKVYATATSCEPGEYTLTIKGTGYQTYSGKVSIKSQYISKLSIKNSHELDDMYSGTKRPGVMGYGDLNGDGKVNQADFATIMDAIEEESKEATYDLNKDGEVTILDASYILYNMDESNVDSTVMQVLHPDCVQEVSATVGKVIGDTADLFSSTGSVQLEPANKNEEISESNPIEIGIEVAANGSKTEAITIAAPVDSTNAITAGTVVVTAEDGEEIEAVITNKAKQATRTRRSKTAATATIESDGSIVVDLGNQIAIKKVTIKVTGTNSRCLAEIAKVEFLNDMESRIPAVTINSPQNIQVTAGNKEFTLNWAKMSNVTGYEVQITSNGLTETVTTGTNSITIKNFGKEELKNGTTFTIRIRATNGDWKSDFSEEVTATPIVTKVPDAPEDISIEGGYKFLEISWKAMDDTDSYNIYYRVKGTEADYQVVKGITNSSYRLSDLEISTAYEIYVQGVNEIGVSKKSQLSIGTTTELEYPKTSNYKLINVPTEDGKTAHIESVTYPSGDVNSEFDIVDNNYGTDWILDSWTSGGFAGNQIGPIITFDDFYTMDRIVLVESAQKRYDIFYSKIRYWDEDGNEHVISGRHGEKQDSTGKRYYEFSLAAPITTNKIQISASNYLAYQDGMLSISELKFYHYDSLEADIYDLFEDDTHVSLKSTVTMDDITALEDRLNQTCEVSGEYHYKRDILAIELQNAKDILNEVALRSAMDVDTSLSKGHDGHVDFQNGLNAWQPLGITAHTGEELVLYVGKNNAKVGDNSNVRLVATQFHAESGKWYSNIVSNLKVGRNEVTIPAISSMAVEHGGALYVEYTSTDTTQTIQVRVSGGTEYPTLDISKLETESEIKSAIGKYLEKLTAYVATLEEMHNEHHFNHPETQCDYEYDNKNCIFNVTDIVMPKMMYSVAAEQILKGLAQVGTDMDSKVDAMYNSMDAMEDMLDLFYQHKGFVEYPTDQEEYKAFVEKYGDKNKLPVSRQNIRYQRMFAGAFMYASGLHIGIEWDSVPALMTSTPVVSNNGKYQSGQYFGWGIAHEIGHIINQSQYAVAEITNNYFSILAQAKETNDSVRFKYSDVYEKVTSGTIGSSDNVFTSLGMYWQLHLAFDNGYNFKTYDNYEDQFNNLIFARMDAYARNHAIAPKFADGKNFTLDGADTDNRLMRLAVAAAKKDILDFFKSWGLVPDETTIEYASQFDKETRMIQYVTDEARAYRIENLANAAEVADATRKATVNGSLTNEKNSNQVTLNFGVTGMKDNSLLGYEIRCNGETIAFLYASQTEYVDTVTFNNKVAEYEVIAYDNFLNTTSVFPLDPIKIHHDGSISKELWSISTNMTSEHDEHDKDDICGSHPIQAISSAIDNDYANTYVGTTTSGNAEIVLNLGEVAQIAGLKYTKSGSNAINAYEIQVSLDGKNWTTVKMGDFTSEGAEEIVYFTKSDDENGTRLDLQTVSYVKLIAKGQKTVSINELDIIGEPEDNVELIKDGIGILQEDYVVDANAGASIPAGSVIFTGEYTGHPAFNVVLLVDAETDEVIEGSQYIFAEDPKDDELTAVSSGTWLYVIEPDENGDLPELPKYVKAELYRVDNAITLEGQRYVSDTLPVGVPEKLPNISIK